jgi:hypothetical protein
VSPTPVLQITGIPMAINSPCLVGEEDFFENFGTIKNIE